jgi:hypothetical protein
MPPYEWPPRIHITGGRWLQAGTAANATNAAKAVSQVLQCARFNILVDTIFAGSAASHKTTAANLP